MNNGFLDTVQEPSRFLGTEINSAHKDWDRALGRAVLLFPDHYDLGMSHLGYKIIYHALNQTEDLLCERAFTPEPELERRLKEEGRGLRSLESGRELSEFDLIGLTLPHELAATNVLTLLDLAGLPLAARERTETHPLVLAGGPAVFNPEPLAEFLDAVFLGEAEEGAVEVLRAVGRLKREGRSREDILAALATIPGVYIPSHYRPVYEEGRFKELEALGPGPAGRIVKRTIPDPDRIFAPSSPIVPFGRPVHDRLAVELARGCSRGCRFCQAGMIYRPVREREPRAILDLIWEAVKRTGYDELSLLALSAGDYSCLLPLLGALMDRLERERISVSLPSLRADTLTRETAELIRRVRMTGFTLAPEAGTERLRAVINKNLNREEILAAAGRAVEAGWRLLKLYFMVGLPTETEEDLEGIVRLVEEMARRWPGVKLNVSLGGFVPKPHTPFQWEAQISAEEMKERMGFIRQGVKRLRQVRVKWNSPDVARLDGLLSRGDRRLARVIRRAWEAGARFEAWSEHFRWEPWGEALAKEGLDLEDYLSTRGEKEPLPWDHLAPVAKSFLLEERRKAFEEALSPDCREGECLDCGACSPAGLKPLLARQEPPPPSLRQERSGPSRRLVFSYHKLGPARFFGHLEMAQILYRAFRRARVRLAYSQGFHPQPRISFLSALPVGAESLDEWAEVEVSDRRPPKAIMDLVNLQLPEGLSLTTMALREEKRRVVSLSYRVSLADPRSGPAFEPGPMEDFLAADRVLYERTRPGKGKVQRFDLRGPVMEMRIIDPAEAELILAVPQEGPTPKPEEVIERVFGIPPTRLRVLKLKTSLESR